MLWGDSPESAAVTATALVPEPTVWAQDAVWPYAVVVPYWNWQLDTVPPLGLTVALSVAAGCEIEVAVPVTTAGGLGRVVKVPSLPLVVPPALVATIWKW